MGLGGPLGGFIADRSVPQFRYRPLAKLIPTIQARMALGLPHSASPVLGLFPADVYQPALRNPSVYHRTCGLGYFTYL